MELSFWSVSMEPKILCLVKFVNCLAQVSLVYKKQMNWSFSGLKQLTLSECWSLKYVLCLFGFCISK